MPMSQSNHGSGEQQRQQQQQEEGTTLTESTTCSEYAGSPAIINAIFTAQVRVGNAAASGAWEQNIGTAVAHHVWAANEHGYLDSNYVTVSFGIERTSSGSLAVWTVGNQTLSATGVSYSSLAGIGVRAEVASHPLDPEGAEGEVVMEWGDVKVTFSDDGDNAEPLPDTVPCNPTASLSEARLNAKTKSGGEEAAQQQGTSGHGNPSRGRAELFVSYSNTALITPPTANDFEATRATLSATVRLRSADPDRKYPPALGATQIIGKIYVWKNA